MKFNPGKLVVTCGVEHLIYSNEAFAKFVHISIRRHIAGDWGEVWDDDRVRNDEALQHGDRLISSFRSDEMPDIWIITERDRSYTTVLFPHEY